MQNLHLIHQKPLLSRIFKDPPVVSYKGADSYRIYSPEQNFRVVQACQPIVITPDHTDNVPLC